MFFSRQMFLSINKHQFFFIILNVFIAICIAIFCFHLLDDTQYFFSTIVSINDVTKPFLFHSSICRIEYSIWIFLRLQVRLFTAAVLLLFPLLSLCLYCLVHILFPPSCYFVLRGSFSPSAAAALNKSSLRDFHKSYTWSSTLTLCLTFLKPILKFPLTSRSFNYQNLYFQNKRLLFQFERLYFYIRAYSAVLRYSFFTGYYFHLFYQIPVFVPESMYSISVLQAQEL